VTVRLHRDTRGGVTLAPVFAIIGVIVLAMVAATITSAAALQAGHAADRNVTMQVRSAVAAAQADLNNFGTCENVATAMSVPSYVPMGYLDSVHEDIDFLGATPAGPACHVQFKVTSTVGRNISRTYTVEYMQAPLIQVNGAWVDAGGSPAERTVWEPTRTVEEG